MLATRMVRVPDDVGAAPRLDDGARRAFERRRVRPDRRAGNAARSRAERAREMRAPRRRPAARGGGGRGTRPGRRTVKMRAGRAALHHTASAGAVDAAEGEEAGARECERGEAGLLLGGANRHPRLRKPRRRVHRLPRERGASAVPTQADAAAALSAEDASLVAQVVGEDRLERDVAALGDSPRAPRHPRASTARLPRGSLRRHRPVPRGPRRARGRARPPGGAPRRGRGHARAPSPQRRATAARALAPGCSRR